jgi:hypothetical protein
MHVPLPPFTFICGPAESGKSTLAALLCSADSGAVRVSFAEPIRNAMAAVFYPDRPLDTPDFRDATVKAEMIPGTPITHRAWMVAFSSFMKQTHTKYIFGELAKRTCESLSEYYSRFVFDDMRYLDEINPFCLAFGKDQCLIIHLERAGKSWKREAWDTTGPQDHLRYTGARHLVLINNGTVDELLPRLHQILENQRATGATNRARS